MRSGQISEFLNYHYQIKKNLGQNSKGNRKTATLEKKFRVPPCVKFSFFFKKCSKFFSDQGPGSLKQKMEFYMLKIKLRAKE
jgi:hypothetical protein